MVWRTVGLQLGTRHRKLLSAARVELRHHVGHRCVHSACPTQIVCRFHARGTWSTRHHRSSGTGFVISFGYYCAAGAILYTSFSLLRTSNKFRRFYAPKRCVMITCCPRPTVTPSNRYMDDDEVGVRPPRMPPSFFGWAPTIMSFSQLQILHYGGMDALILVRVLNFGTGEIYLLLVPHRLHRSPALVHHGDGAHVLHPPAHLPHGAIATRCTSIASTHTPPQSGSPDVDPINYVRSHGRVLLPTPLFTPTRPHTSSLHSSTSATSRLATFGYGLLQ